MSIQPSGVVDSIPEAASSRGIGARMAPKASVPLSQHCFAVNASDRRCGKAVDSEDERVAGVGKRLTPSERPQLGPRVREAARQLAIQVSRSLQTVRAADYTDSGRTCCRSTPGLHSIRHLGSARPQLPVAGNPALLVLEVEAFYEID